MGSLSRVHLSGRSNYWASRQTPEGRGRVSLPTASSPPSSSQPHTLLPARRAPGQPARPGSLRTQASPNTANEEEEGEENKPQLVCRQNRNKQNQTEHRQPAGRWGARGREQTSGERREVWEDPRGQVLRSRAQIPLRCHISVLKPLEPGPGCPLEPLAKGVTREGNGKQGDESGRSSCREAPTGQGRRKASPVILPLENGVQRGAPKPRLRGWGGGGLGNGRRRSWSKRKREARKPPSRPVPAVSLAAGPPGAGRARGGPNTSSAVTKGLETRTPEPSPGAPPPRSAV